MALFSASRSPSLKAEGLGIEAVAGGGLIGLLIVLVEHLAASKCRPTPAHSGTERATTAAVALVAGVGLGAPNLCVNVGLATTDAE